MNKIIDLEQKWTIDYIFEYDSKEDIKIKNFLISIWMMMYNNDSDTLAAFIFIYSDYSTGYILKNIDAGSSGYILTDSMMTNPPYPGDVVKYSDVIYTITLIILKKE